ncbi:MAG: class I SAM-dependent methyltransferase [Phycisphaerales bacterium]
MFGRREKSASESCEPAYLRPYAEVARRVGARFEALLWQNAEGQQRRFDVLAEMLAPEDRAMADLGCGRADLLVHLHGIGRTPRRYVGVDGIAAMVEAARQQIAASALREASVLQADFVADPGCFAELVRAHGVDTLVFSGSLNTLEQHQAERVLERAFAALPSGGALAFNFLSDLYPAARASEQGPAFRFSTLGMLAWALRRTPLVRFRHDYLGGHDATIAMFRPSD